MSASPLHSLKYAEDSTRTNRTSIRLSVPSYVTETLPKLVKEEIGGTETTAESPKVESVKRQITLEEILADCRCFPLRRRDFQNYLQYEEHSEENLLFYNWYKTYEKKYSTWEPGQVDGSIFAKARAPNHEIERTQTPSIGDCGSANPSLIDLAVRASASDLQPYRLHVNQVLDLFFTEGGQFELNLDQKIKKTVFRNAQFSTQPRIFQVAAYSCLEMMKSSSLPHFLRLAQDNVNRPKQIFWYTSGTILSVLGLIVYLLCIFLVSLRPWRLIGIPFTWLGAMQFYSATQRICFQVYSRRVRQIFRWDLIDPMLQMDVFSSSNDDDGDVSRLIGHMRGRVSTPPPSKSKVFENEIPIEDEYILRRQKRTYLKVLVVGTTIALVIIAVMLSVPNYIDWHSM